jgi:hypothetical protein
VQREFERLPLQVTDSSQAPKGKDIFYRCLTCDFQMPSSPKESCVCTCRNIGIDKDWNRLVVRDFTAFAVLKMKPQTSGRKPQNS